MGFDVMPQGLLPGICESPEKGLLLLTNNFVPCNGRFPTLIALSTVFLLSKRICLWTFTCTNCYRADSIFNNCNPIGFLSPVKNYTQKASLTLPWNCLQDLQELAVYYILSIIDRTIFVLARAVMVAIPAGAITWILGNIYIGDLSLIGHGAQFFNPLAKLIGLDGYILMAFILGLPANEIVLPILLMSYLSTGSMIDFDSLDSLRTILLENGWTYLTALNTMLFCLFHWPCATTLLTIKKETGSTKWTVLAALIPTLVAIIICSITTIIFRLLGWG